MASFTSTGCAGDINLHSGKLRFIFNPTAVIAEICIHYP